MKRKEKRIEETLEKQNEEARKDIAEGRDIIIKHIDSSKEALIIMSDAGFTAIGGYTQCKKVVTNALAAFLAQGMFDADDLHEMVTKAVIVDAMGPIFKEE